VGQDSPGKARLQRGRECTTWPPGNAELRKRRHRSSTRSRVLKAGRDSRTRSESTQGRFDPATLPNEKQGIRDQPAKQALRHEGRGTRDKPSLQHEKPGTPADPPHVSPTNQANVDTLLRLQLPALVAVRATVQHANATWAPVPASCELDPLGEQARPSPTPHPATRAHCRSRMHQK
jgi:hypothetical protein